MVTPEFKEAVGDCDGIFSTDTWNPGFLPAKGEEAVAIEQQYQDEYGMRMNENAGCAWNAMAVMVAALEAAGSHRRRRAAEGAQGDGSARGQQVHDHDPV